MKLSEAIRFGGYGRPQCKWNLISYHKDGNQYCAIGGALSYAGLKDHELAYDAMSVLFPVVWVTCSAPMTESTLERTTVYRFITHANDILGWSRDKIADWVETIEMEEEAKAKAEENKNVAKQIGTLQSV
jgi:hypothetical protein